MKRLTIIFLSLLLGLSSSCSFTPVKFSKAGAQPGDFENAQYDCKVQADRSAGAIAYAQDPLAHLNYLGQARQEMVDCLVRQGWKASTK